MPTAETALLVSQADHRLRAVMSMLLYRLKRFVSVYPAMEGERMPEHDVQWVEFPDAGPQRTIIDAIRMHPELWAEALPPQCCIVHRDTLRKYVGADAAEYMESHGANAVSNQAARLLYENEERERLERYTKTTPA